MPRPRNRTALNHNFFHDIDSEPKAYWLGFLMADGCVHDTMKKGCLQLSVHLASKDLGHLEKLRMALGIVKPVYVWHNSIRLAASSDHLCNDLIRHGCTPRKSLTLRFPSIIPTMLPHFIRGYFDGDGCACICHDRLFISFVGTQSFLNSLRHHCRIVRSLCRRGNIYTLSINKITDLQHIVTMMYDTATVYLERKRDIALAGIERKPTPHTCRTCHGTFWTPPTKGRNNRRYCGLPCRGKANRLALSTRRSRTLPQSLPAHMIALVKSPRRQEAMRFHYVENLSRTATAIAMGITPQAVTYLLAAAVHELQASKTNFPLPQGTP